MDKKSLKDLFSIKFYGTFKAQRPNRYGVQEFESWTVFYKNDKVNRRISCTSELACWRIIDMAIFLLLQQDGQDPELLDNHKVLMRKARYLVNGEKIFSKFK